MVKELERAGHRFDPALFTPLLQRLQVCHQVVHLLGVQLALAENNWAEAEELLADRE